MRLYCIISISPNKNVIGGTTIVNETNKVYASEKDLPGCVKGGGDKGQSPHPLERRNRTLWEALSPNYLDNGGGHCDHKDVPFSFLPHILCGMAGGPHRWRTQGWHKRGTQGVSKGAHKGL
jgi:hypothetical protein